MISNSDIETAATDLFQAEARLQQMGLLSLRHPELNLDGAYQIQARLVEKKQQAGRKIIGWKIGLTSKAMQDALGITTPDSGVLFDDMLFAEGSRIAKGRFIQPRIEAEIAFVMGQDLPLQPVTVEDVLAATAYVSPAIEILDTRILRQDPVTKARRTVIDTVSDNAANAGLILGQARHALSAFDLRWVGAIVFRNDEVEETGLGAGVLNNPALSVAWLANRLMQYGAQIKRGDIILSGSFIRPVEAFSGTRFLANFGDFGTVSCQFD